MIERFSNLFTSLALLSLSLGIVLWVPSVSFSQDTFPVPETAEVTLNWDPTEPVPEGYRLYQRREGQSYDYNQPRWTGPGTTATIYNLDWDTTYYFVVRAYVGSEESADSNEVTFLSPSPPPAPYTIAVVTGSNGTVSPGNTVTVDSGADQTFTISPDTGYYVSDVKVDGSSVGAVLSYTFNQVTANHTLDVSFAIDTHTITASAGANGAITPAGSTTVNNGSAATYTIVPDAGCHVGDVTVDGVSVGAISSYTFSQVTADHTINASFAINTHTLLATTDTYGSISPSGDVILDHGASQGFTITPDSGYSVADVLVDGSSVGPISAYQFNQVIEDHTIHATFVADTYIISAMAGDNGTITPSGSTSVSFGDSQTYTIAPNSDCSITDVIVDGVSVGSTTTYTFSDIKENHIIEALFALENLSPTADAGPDQTVDENRVVTISGLNSIDPDDGIATFQWRQIQGLEVVLNSPESPETTFTTPNVDTSGTALVFELTVTDYSGTSSVDNCIVNVTWVNVPPTANADMDQIVSEGSQVTLNGDKSSDSDDGIESYMWKQLIGPAVILSDDRSATPAFQAPNVGPEGSSMIFEITVRDTGGLQDTDTTLITVAWVNIPPVANAGPDQEISKGDEVTLDGSLSTDTDGDMVVSYRWRQTDGVPVELSDTTAQQPVFVAPDMGNEGGLLTFELTVTDSGGMMATDTCQVIIDPETPSEDTIPPNLTIADPIGDPITVSWHKISFSGTAWDDREVAQVVWKNSTGSSGIAMGTTQWFIDRVMLKRGENVITVTAYDTSGNQSTISKTLYMER